MEAEKTLFRKLFYNSNDELDVLLTTLDKEKALQMIKLALEDAIYSNVFTMHEIEIISKSLRYIENELFDLNQKGKTFF